MVETTNIKCGECGAHLHRYDLYDRDTGETEGTHTVCPNEWRDAHP